MKYYLLIFLFFIVACKDNPVPDKIPGMLKKTMIAHLYERMNGDSSKVKYRMEEVAYFAEKKQYICDFKVRMIVPGKIDTIGVMRAYISKDFKEVKRAQ